MLISAGAALYTVNCAPCHQQNGEGRLHRFPALNQNAFVTNQSPQPLIRTVLDGRGVMPAYAATLSDSEIAAILSYIRQAWNNDADVVTPTQVRELYAQR
jgi:mono/diheme cytochrome c family protein